MPFGNSRCFSETGGNKFRLQFIGCEATLLFPFFTWTSVTSVCWESFWRSFSLNKINIPVQTSPGLSLSFWGETRDALQDKRQCKRVMGKAASVCIGKDSKHYLRPIGAVTSCWCHTWYCVPDACGNKHSAMHNNQWLAYNLKMTILKSNFILMSNISNGSFFFIACLLLCFFCRVLERKVCTCWGGSTKWVYSLTLPSSAPTRTNTTIFFLLHAHSASLLVTRTSPRAFSTNTRAKCYTGSSKQEWLRDGRCASGSLEWN